MTMLSRMSTPVALCKRHAVQGVREQNSSLQTPSGFKIGSKKVLTPLNPAS